MGSAAEEIVPANDADRMGWVYAVHREDGSIAYVGKTVGLPAERFRGHVRDAMRGSRIPFHVWLRGVIEQGHSPKVSPVERCDQSILHARETYWIQHFHAEQAGDTLNVVGLDWPVPTERSIEMDRRKREKAERMERAFHEVCAQFFSDSDDGPHTVTDARIRLERACRMMSVRWTVTRETVRKAAPLHGFDVRGDDAWIVRAGTKAAEMCRSDISPMDRVRAYVASARKVSASGVIRETLVEAYDAKRCLIALGWHFDRRAWRKKL